MTRAAGEGTLYQDDRGRWIAMASAGINPKSGKRRRVKLTGAEGESKEGVARRLADRIAELETQSPAAPQTVGELVRSWRRRAAPKKMSSRTLAMVDSLIANHIDPVLGGVKVGALTAEDVEDFLDARAGDYARSTLTKLRSILAQSYDFGIRRRHVNWNPARVAELPPETREAKKGRALTADETALLLKAAEDDRLGAWIVVGLTLGLRPEEVSGLTWDAIDYGRYTLTVYQALGVVDGKPALKDTKTGGVRTIELPGVTIDALVSHRSASTNERRLMTDWPDEWEHLVFVSTNGLPLDRTSMRRRVQKLATAAGIEGKVNPRDLRTTCTTLLSDTMSAERLADLLGHKDTRMVFAHYRQRGTQAVSTAANYWDGA